MEENIDDELTFKKVWQQIKRSGVRMIIYALIALIVSGGILGICDIFLSESQYETNITYYYSGIELGNDPWGGQDDVVAGIKSANNVSSALDKLEFSDKEKDALVSLIIRNLIVITSVDKEEVDENDVVTSGNYNFRIVLSQDADIDKHIKSRNDYYNIVNAITTTYIENFKQTYSFGTKLVDLASLNNYNAFQRYDIIRSYFNAFSQESKTLAQMAPDFVSTSQKTSFASLSARIDISSQKLEKYLSYILRNGINNSGEDQYLALKLKESSGNIDIYEKEIEALNNVLDSLMQNGNASVPSSGPIVVNPSDPKVVTEALTLAIANRTAAQMENNNWKIRNDNFKSENFPSEPEQQKPLIEEANSLELEIIKEYNDILASYKSMIEEYNKGYNLSSLVKMTSVPKQVTTSPITLKMAIIIEVLVLLIAIMVAMVVTSKKGAMVLRKKAQEEDDVVVIEDEQSVNGQNVEPQGLPTQSLGEPDEEDK